MTLQIALARLRDVCGLYALPNFEGGLYQEGASDPTDDTPVHTPFFVNTTTGAVFALNVNRDAWEQVASAGDLTPSGESLLTADT